MRLPYELQTLTSEVDWCEPNFAVTLYVVEFVNTVTNLPLIAFPFLQFVFFNNFSHLCKPNLRYVLITLQLVGIGSTYYHATLSFAGQLMDECGILWSLSWLSSGYWPESWLPCGIKSRSKLTLSYVFLAFLFTILSIRAPRLNQFGLIVFGSPFVLSLWFDYFYRKEQLTSTAKLCFRRLMLGFAIAFFVWSLDKSFCPFWRALSFPYLHGVWHILTAYSTSYGMALAMYQDLFAHGFNSSQVKLKFFPSALMGLGMPYIEFIP